MQVNLYEAFGGIEASWGNSKNNRLANTKERDASIALDNHGFRYYDASIGRYISNDPIGYEGGFNLYVHCTNDPVNKFDPLGLSEDEEEKKKVNRIEIEPSKVKGSEGRAILNTKGGIRIDLGEIFRGNTEYAMGDAHLDDGTSNTLLRHLDASAKRLDVDGILRNKLDATSKGDLEDKLKDPSVAKEVAQYLAKTLKKERNFSLDEHLRQYRTSPEQTASVKDVAGDNLRRRMAEGKDVYNRNGIDYGEDRFGLYSNAYMRNRAAENRVFQMELVLKGLEYGVDGAITFGPMAMGGVFRGAGAFDDVAGMFAPKVRFAQKGISPTFRHGEFAGQSIDDVAAALRSGRISPDQLPIQTVTRDGAQYTVNNRSLMTLRKADMEPTVVKDVTGNAIFERQITQRLNELGGTVADDFVPVVRGGTK